MFQVCRSALAIRSSNPLRHEFTKRGGSGRSISSQRGPPRSPRLREPSHPEPLLPQALQKLRARELSFHQWSESRPWYLAPARVRRQVKMEALKMRLSLAFGEPRAESMTAWRPYPPAEKLLPPGLGAARFANSTLTSNIPIANIRSLPQAPCTLASSSTNFCLRSA